MQEATLLDVCHVLLAEADSFAVENVQASRGGPFGAISALLNPQTGEFVRIGAISANAVLATGMGSAHAEDQGLQPDNLQALVLGLQKWNLEGKSPSVVFASSGQSCQACHAKEEIVARQLLRMGLIAPGRFVVAYGAPFEDTAKIAGFNDLPYVLDLVRFAKEPQSLISMVKHHVASSAEIPDNVRQVFLDASAQVTVLVRGDKILSIGHDNRAQFDPISTAEVDAIRHACGDQKAQGVALPWLLGDENHISPDPAKKAILYTTTREIGPLMRGEAQWAAVNEIVSVEGVSNFATQETPDMSNGQFLQAMASGYNHAGSVLRVVHDEMFGNLAQYEWAAKLTREGASILYNGVGSDADLARFVSGAAVAFAGEPLRL